MPTEASKLNGSLNNVAFVIYHALERDCVCYLNQKKQIMAF